MVLGREDPQITTTRSDDLFGVEKCGRLPYSVLRSFPLDMMDALDMIDARLKVTVASSDGIGQRKARQTPSGSHSGSAERSVPSSALLSRSLPLDELEVEGTGDGGTEVEGDCGT